ncbi:carboxymuconolactone decarboxylase family protein [Nocardia sp. NPDC127526]|uniref:carboxymuconolactone decarboxylase family protein n=1 Tax=Nocardia sp. NPDC127526 TaxID=3345393 RepID=UPI0036376F3C
MDGLGWPAPREPRLRPRWGWLRYAFPGSTQVCWIGTAHPRLLAVLFALEAPAEFGQGLLATLRHRDLELLVLRASWNAGHFYHYSVHALWARIRERAGFLDSVHAGSADRRWNDRQAALLCAADELHEHLAITPETIARLRELGIGDRELVEICFVTAHYELIGMLEESAGMPPEPLLGRPRSGTGAQPRRRRTGIRGRAPGLNPATPWTPGDTALAPHRALRTIVGWYGRTMARVSTLDAVEIGALLQPSPDTGTERARLLHRAITELDREYFLSDGTWRELLNHLTIRQIMELCVLVGHYRTHEMLANTMANTADVSE